MPLTKVLITVTTYPLPSRSYDELVCTAGITEDGRWIRIYPVPLSSLFGLKKDGKIQQTKYSYIQLDLNKRTDDFRPESHSPKHYDFKDITVIEHLATKGNWHKRKEFCLKEVYTSFDELIELSKAPINKSLATFKPTEIIGFEYEKDDPEWKNEWKALREQGDLFDEEKSPEILIPKLPFKFFYKFKDSDGKTRRLMIEDWEIGQLYWNCLKSTEGNEGLALEKVRQKLEEEFVTEKDLYFFVGTTREWHTRRSKNPFVIIGLFYPKKEDQLSLF
ncbi:MAG: hypothetical protein V4638_04790 [Bacteroidota bacterium]